MSSVVGSLLHMLLGNKGSRVDYPLDIMQVGVMGCSGRNNTWEHQGIAIEK